MPRPACGPRCPARPARPRQQNSCPGLWPLHGWAAPAAGILRHWHCPGPRLLHAQAVLLSGAHALPTRPVSVSRHGGGRHPAGRTSVGCRARVSTWAAPCLVLGRALYGLWQAAWPFRGVARLRAAPLAARQAQTPLEPGHRKFAKRLDLPRPQPGPGQDLTGRVARHHTVWFKGLWGLRGSKKQGARWRNRQRLRQGSNLRPLDQLL